MDLRLQGPGRWRGSGCVSRHLAIRQLFGGHQLPHFTVLLALSVLGFDAS
jgi:hypothetical protein